MSPYRLFLVMSGVSAFALDAAFTLNLVYQARVVGLNPLQLVLVGTLLEVVIFAAQIPTGVIADLVSRRLSVVIGYLLHGAGLVVWGLVPTYAGVLIGNAVVALGVVCVDGAREAWAADEIGEDRAGRAFVRAGQFGSAGTFLGILAAVGLATFGLAVPIVAGGVVMLALGVFLALVMPENNWSPAPHTSLRSQLVAGGRAVRRSTMLTGLVAGTVFAGLSSEGFDRLSQPHFLTDLQFPGTVAATSWFGAFAVIAALGSIVTTGLIGSRLDTLHPQYVGRLLAVVQAVTAAGIIWFALTCQFWTAAALYLLVTLLRESTGPILAVWLISVTTSATRATVFSIQSQADALGQIAGGPPTGLVARHRSLGAGIATSGLFLLPAVALFAVAARRSPQVSPLVSADADPHP